MPLYETPDIHLDNKNFIFVNPTEVLLVMEKNGIFVSVFAQHNTKFVGVSSGVQSPVYNQKVHYAKLFTNAGQTAVSTHCVAHFFE